MLFNSWIFVWFLFLFLPAYALVVGRRSIRGRNALILVASYIFYGWWDWRFCGLLALSTVVDFSVARRMPAADEVRRKQLLRISVVTNLSVLGVFKYLGFFMDSASDVLEALGLSSSATTLSIVLPVGISFYTFQTLSYTIDVYRGELEPSNSLLDVATFVAFFPQLVAGPIERASHLLPQIQTTRTPKPADLLVGSHLILTGYVKKIVFADNLAIVANDVFAEPGAYSGFGIIAGVLAFTFQIYCDFSGYTDMPAVWPESWASI